MGYIFNDEKSTCLCKVQLDLILEIDRVYYATLLSISLYLLSDLKIHAQKSARISVSVQKIGESRGNTRNSIPDVEMNNLPLALSRLTLLGSPFFPRILRDIPNARKIVYIFATLADFVRITRNDKILRRYRTIER